MTIGESFLTTDNYANAGLVLAQPFRPVMGNNILNSIEFKARYYADWDEVLDQPTNEVTLDRWTNITPGGSGFTISTSPGISDELFPVFLREGSKLRVRATFTKTAPDLIDFDIRIYNQFKSEFVTVTIQDLSGAAYTAELTSTESVVLPSDWDGFLIEIDNNGTNLTWETLNIDQQHPVPSIRATIHEYFVDGTTLNIVPVENGVSSEVVIASPVVANYTVTFSNLYLENKLYLIVLKPTFVGRSTGVEIAIKEEDGITDTFDEPLEFLNSSSVYESLPTPIVSDTYYLGAELDYTVSAYTLPFVWDCGCNDSSDNWESVETLLQAKLDEVYAESALTIQINSSVVPTVEDWEREWEANGGTLPIPVNANLIWYDNSQDLYGGWFKLYEGSVILMFGIYTKGTALAYLASGPYSYQLRPMWVGSIVNTGVTEGQSGSINPAGLGFLDGTGTWGNPNGRAQTTRSADFVTGFGTGIAPTFSIFAIQQLTFEVINEWQ